MATTYKIGEAAALLNLKTYVLRFWETEFPEIVPLRTEKGQRLYTTEHLALLDRIRYLLHERGLTIGGARKLLAEEKDKKVKYVFGAHGALKDQDAEAGRPARGAERQERGKEEAAPEKGSDPDARRPGKKTVPDDGESDEDEDDELDEELGEDGESDEDYPDEDAGPSPFALPEGPGQYNLPGLDALSGFRASLRERHKILDSGSREGYGGAEEGAGDAAALRRESPRGMLPLFAVARAAFTAGKAEAARGKGSGGDNFLQPGPALPKTATRLQDEEFEAIALELEAIAELLRPPANSAKGSLA